MNTKTQAEYDRIKAGPHSGAFTLLHHRGPVVEYSKNVMERVADILSGREDKPVSQQYDRLRHIYPVTAPAYQAYQEAIAPADKKILAVIPDCAWNGKTILG